MAYNLEANLMIPRADGAGNVRIRVRIPKTGMDSMLVDITTDGQYIQIAPERYKIKELIKMLMEGL